MNGLGGGGAPPSGPPRPLGPPGPLIRPPAGIDPLGRPLGPPGALKSPQFNGPMNGPVKFGPLTPGGAFRPVGPPTGLKSPMVNGGQLGPPGARPMGPPQPRYSPGEVHIFGSNKKGCKFSFKNPVKTL